MILILLYSYLSKILNAGFILVTEHLYTVILLLLPKTWMLLPPLLASHDLTREGWQTNIWFPFKIVVYPSTTWDAFILIAESTHFWAIQATCGSRLSNFSLGIPAIYIMWQLNAPITKWNNNQIGVINNDVITD